MFNSYLFAIKIHMPDDTTIKVRTYGGDVGDITIDSESGYTCKGTLSNIPDLTIAKANKYTTHSLGSISFSISHEDAETFLSKITKLESGFTITDSYNVFADVFVLDRTDTSNIIYTTGKDNKALILSNYSLEKGSINLTFVDVLDKVLLKNNYGGVSLSANSFNEVADNIAQGASRYLSNNGFEIYNRQATGEEAQDTTKNIGNCIGVYDGGSNTNNLIVGDGGFQNITEYKTIEDSFSDTTLESAYYYVNKDSIWNDAGKSFCVSRDGKALIIAFDKYTSYTTTDRVFTTLQIWYRDATYDLWKWCYQVNIPYLISRWDIDPGRYGMTISDFAIDNVVGSDTNGANIATLLVTGIHPTTNTSLDTAYEDTTFSGYDTAEAVARHAAFALFSHIEDVNNDFLNSIIGTFYYRYRTSAANPLNNTYIKAWLDEIFRINTSDPYLNANEEDVDTAQMTLEDFYIARKEYIANIIEVEDSPGQNIGYASRLNKIIRYIQYSINSSISSMLTAYLNPGSNIKYVNQAVIDRFLLVEPSLAIKNDTPTVSSSGYNIPDTLTIGSYKPFYSKPYLSQSSLNFSTYASSLDSSSTLFSNVTPSDTNNSTELNVLSNESYESYSVDFDIDIYHVDGGSNQYFTFYNSSTTPNTGWTATATWWPKRQIRLFIDEILDLILDKKLSHWIPTDISNYPIVTISKINTDRKKLKIRDKIYDSIIQDLTDAANSINLTYSGKYISITGTDVGGIYKYTFQTKNLSLKLEMGSSISTLNAAIHNNFNGNSIDITACNTLYATAIEKQTNTNAPIEYGLENSAYNVFYGISIDKEGDYLFIGEPTVTGSLADDDQTPYNGRISVKHVKQPNADSFGIIGTNPWLDDFFDVEHLGCIYNTDKVTGKLSRMEEEDIFGLTIRYPMFGMSVYADNNWNVIIGAPFAINSSTGNQLRESGAVILSRVIASKRNHTKWYLNRPRVVNTKVFFPNIDTVKYFGANVSSMYNTISANEYQTILVSGINSKLNITLEEEGSDTEIDYSVVLGFHLDLTAAGITYDNNPATYKDYKLSPLLSNLTTDNNKKLYGGKFTVPSMQNTAAAASDNYAYMFTSKHRSIHPVMQNENTSASLDYVCYIFKFAKNLGKYAIHKELEITTASNTYTYNNVKASDRCGILYSRDTARDSLLISRHDNAGNTSFIEKLNSNFGYGAANITNISRPYDYGSFTYFAVLFSNSKLKVYAISIANMFSTGITAVSNEITVSGTIKDIDLTVQDSVNLPVIAIAKNDKTISTEYFSTMFNDTDSIGSTISGTTLDLTSEVATIGQIRTFSLSPSVCHILVKESDVSNDLGIFTANFGTSAGSFSIDSIPNEYTTMPTIDNVQSLFLGNTLSIGRQDLSEVYFTGTCSVGGNFTTSIPKYIDGSEKGTGVIVSPLFNDYGYYNVDMLQKVSLLSSTSFLSRQLTKEASITTVAETVGLASQVPCTLLAGEVGFGNIQIYLADLTKDINSIPRVYQVFRDNLVLEKTEYEVYRVPLTFRDDTYIATLIYFERNQTSIKEYKITASIFGRRYYTGISSNYTNNTDGTLVPGNDSYKELLKFRNRKGIFTNAESDAYKTTHGRISDFRSDVVKNYWTARNELMYLFNEVLLRNDIDIASFTSGSATDGRVDYAYTSSAQLSSIMTKLLERSRGLIFRNSSGDLEYRDRSYTANTSAITGLGTNTNNIDIIKVSSASSLGIPSGYELASRKVYSDGVYINSIEKKNTNNTLFTNTSDRSYKKITSEYILFEAEAEKYVNTITVEDAFSSALKVSLKVYDNSIGVDDILTRVELDLSNFGLSSTTSLVIQSLKLDKHGLSVDLIEYHPILHDDTQCIA